MGGRRPAGAHGSRGGHLIADILPRLEKVRKTGSRNWIACCPAHDDRSPSLTLAETDDGRVLVHCFGGCDIGAIVGAVGLGWDPWYPPKPVDYQPKVRAPFPAADVLQAVAFESMVVAVAAQTVAHGGTLEGEDLKRVMVAHQRLQKAKEMALGE